MHCWLWTYFTPSSSSSIVDFDKQILAVNLGSLPKYTCQSLVCYIKCAKNGEGFSVRLGNDLWGYFQDLCLKGAL